MEEQFSRTALLIGAGHVEKLQASRVIVFGLGGVGGTAVEALARAGVGTIGLVDNDTVCLSNLNRQIIATHQNLGAHKTDAAAQRIADINPAAKVNRHKIFYLPETAHEIDLTAYDYIIDAVDTVTAKIELALQAQKKAVPLISCMGTGNKLQPAAFEVADIYKTSVCPLAKVLRSELKKRGVKHLKVVFSKEPPAKHRPPGSISFVPPAAGLLLAATVIHDLLGLRVRYEVGFAL
ncbi:MAG: tRNA threonylcarbamoyladenosine dehydratase [Firmicutes bacterium]|nr:tRNA threonylcarbamoyladenosine dehydratase [Bacillota bacterium]